MNATLKTALTWIFAGVLVASLVWTGTQLRIVRSGDQTTTTTTHEESGASTTESTEETTTTAYLDEVPQEEWIEVTGEVVSSEDNTLVIRTAEGAEMEIGLGPLGYWLGHGIPFSPGDQVRILGFYGTDDEFEPAQIFNLTTDQSVTLRDADGSPLWRGSESH